MGTSLQAGQTVGHYRIVRQIGAGGMGVVFEAEDLKLGRHVALKFLPFVDGEDTLALERFRREARIASALNHPNICTIHDIGECDGRAMIAMELLEGKTLHSLIKEGPLKIDEALALGIQIADALEAAHRKNIIHRDIKPANIFVTREGKAKVLDFGLAKFGHSEVGETNITSHTLTQAGSTMGTIGYMSPEQLRGEIPDVRSDLFPFGVVLYQMVSGELPFAGNTSALVCEAILNRDPLPLSRWNPDIPAGVEVVVTKALEKDRELRYQHAYDVGADLAALRRDADVSRTRVQVPVDLRLKAQAPLRSNLRQSGTPASAASGSTRTRRQRLYVFAVALLLLSVASALLWFHYQKQPRHLTDKDKIIVADVDNRTGDPALDGTLKTALLIALSESPFLNVMSEPQVADALRHMRLGAETNLTPLIAKEVCQRSGGTAYVFGSITRMGEQYALSLTAAKCDTSDTLAMEQVVAKNKESILDRLSVATGNLRTKLGESVSSVGNFNTPLEQATTTSLDALKLYSEGYNVYQHKGSQESIPYFDQSIQSDPKFSLAYLMLGHAYLSEGQTGRASTYYEKAYELREYTSKDEAFAVRCNYELGVRGALQQAIDCYRQFIAAYPHFGAEDALGRAFQSAGEYPLSIETILTAQRLFPDESVSYINLVISFLATQNLSAAQQQIDAAFQKHMEDPGLHALEYFVGFLQKDTKLMTEQRRWLAERPEQRANNLSLDAENARFLGHIREADVLSSQAAELSIKSGDAETAAIILENRAIASAALGESAEIHKDIEAGLKLDGSRGVVAEAMLAAGMSGYSGLTVSLSKRLEAQYPGDTQLNSLWLPAAKASLYLHTRNAAAAIDALRPAMPPIEYGAIAFAQTTSCMYPTYLRGQAYLSLGDGKAAAAEFQKIIEHSGIVWNCWTGALAQLGVARANALQVSKSTGTQKAETLQMALSAYKNFLTLWKNADPDNVVRKQANAEYARLAGAGSASPPDAGSPDGGSSAHAGRPRT